MENKNAKATKTYLIAMGTFWLIFGLITTFYPALMNMFQTENGINSITDYSNHVWRHDGLDIISVSLLLFVLSTEPVSRKILLAASVVALLVAIGIASSLLTTNYWNTMFIVPGVSCFAFAVWGFALASKNK